MATESRFIAEAAAKECQIMGMYEIDEEHLFLALLVIGGPSAEYLINSGFELTAARTAALRRITDLAGSIGLDFSAASSGLIDDRQEAPDTQWSVRALALMRSVRARDTDLVLLNALWKSPTGAVRNIANRCGLPHLNPEKVIDHHGSKPDANATYEQIAPVSSERLRQVLNLDATNVFNSRSAPEFQLDADGTVSLSAGPSERTRTTVFEIVGEENVRLRATVKPFALTPLGKLLSRPVNSSLRNSLRRQVMLVIQAA